MDDGAAFYCRQSAVTDPGPWRHLFAGLPTSVAELSAVVRDVVLHRDETLAVFGFPLPEARQAEADTRYAAAVLARLGSLRRRPPAERFAGTCRDFALLL